MLDQLDARKESLSSLLSFSANPKPIIVPSFQREYKWSDAKVLELLKHTDPDDESFGFLGTMVFVKDSKGGLEVVDGQQRLLSFVVILCALRDYYHEIGKKILNEQADSLLADKFFEVSKRSIQYETVYRLDPLSESALERITFNRPGFSYIRDNYLSCTPSVPNPETPIEAEAKLFKKNYEAVASHLKEKYKDQTNYQFLLGLLRIRIEKLRTLAVNVIYLGSPEYATEVFETINAMGETLKLPDLVKNFLYKAIKNSDVERDWATIVANCGGHDSEIERVIRYHWAIQYDTSEGEIYRSIRKNVDNPQQYLSRIVKASKIYRFVNHPSNATYTAASFISQDPSNYKTDIITITEAVAAFKTTQYARLILACKFYAAEYLRIQDWVRLFKLIEAFQVRAFITRESQTSKPEKVYVMFSKKLYQICKGSNDARYLSERVKTLLFDELPKEMQKIVPDDEFFVAFEKFKRAVQSPKETRITKYLFSKIERHLSRGESSFDYKNKNTTLEEVLPQDFNAWGIKPNSDEVELIFNIGNTTVLLQKDNGAASNSPAIEKLKVYKLSTLKINTELTQIMSKQPGTWGKEDIHNRAQKLAEQAVNVWTLDSRLIKA